MAALPKFSFSGWNSQSLAPKVPVKTPSQIALESAGGIEGIQLKGLVDAGLGQSPMAIALRDKLNPAATGTGTGTGLVGTTNAANTNLPAWLQSEVDRLNAQEALRAAALGGGGGGGAPAPTQNVGDILQGVAAITAARTGHNQQVFGMNEAARLQNLIQQRNQMRPANAFGFNNPMDVERGISLDREIAGYRNVNLPLASGWVGGGGGQRRGTIWANGLLNGTGYA